MQGGWRFTFGAQAKNALPNREGILAFILIVQD